MEMDLAIGRDSEGAAVWRLLQGIIPMNLNLINCFVNVDPVCARCGESIESTEHALRDFPSLVECWTSFHFPLNMQDQSMSMEDWLMQTVQGLSKEN